MCVHEERLWRMLCDCLLDKGVLCVCVGGSGLCAGCVLNTYKLPKTKGVFHEVCAFLVVIFHGSS